MAVWVKPGDDFVLETYDWTGGAIKNDDSADDVRDVDLSTVHFLSGPVGVEGAEPGDLLVVDLLDIGAKPDSLWGFNGFFSRNNGGGFLTDHFPHAQKSIWDFHGMFTSSRHVPGVNFAGLIHPGLIGCLPDKKLLDDWNKREQALIDTNPNRVPPLANPPAPKTAHMGALQGADRDRAAAEGAHGAARARRQLRYQDLSARACSSRSTSRAAACRWATCTSRRATAKSPSAAPSRWPAGPHARVADQGRHGQVRHPQSHFQAQPDHADLQGLPDLRRHLGRRAGQAALSGRECGYRQACLNAIEYLKKFGYSGAQAYSILGCAPVQGHISGVVDIPNSCATLWLPTEIFDFDIQPSASGPVKHIKGGVDMPLSRDR